MKLTSRLLSILLILSSFVVAGMPVHAATAPPNILIVLTDDVGLLNIGACHRGLMSSRTPNIDRIAKEGMLFTDYYAQPTCTAGRSAMITGQFGKSHLGDRDEFLPTRH